MVNTRKKFPRGILDQVISNRDREGSTLPQRAPDPGLKLQASKLSNQPVQASSDKRQASQAE